MPKVFFCRTFLSMIILSLSFSQLAFSAPQISCKLVVKTDDYVKSQEILEEISAPNVPEAPLLYSSSTYNVTASIKVNNEDRKAYAIIYRVFGFRVSSGWVDLDYGFQSDDWTTVATYQDKISSSPSDYLEYSVVCKR